MEFIVRDAMPSTIILHQWLDGGVPTVWLNRKYPDLWPDAALRAGIDPRRLPRHDERARNAS